MSNIKSYAHRSDAVRAFKKAFGAAAYTDRSVFAIAGRFGFYATPETSVKVADCIPADLLKEVSAKLWNTSVKKVHPAETFPGRERHIAGWIETENGRAIAINRTPFPKTGVTQFHKTKVVVVKV